MKLFKSLYIFSKGERRGIFLLIFLMMAFQLIWYGMDYIFPSSADLVLDHSENKIEQSKIDAQKVVVIQANKPKIYPFNPNFLTDYRAYVLGLSPAEFDKLQAYRKQDKFVNSATEFQKITGIHDTLLQAIQPYFKFPDWVNNPNKSNFKDGKSYANSSDFKQKSANVQKVDLNLATKEQLIEINGIGEKLAERIVTYRTKLQGFSFNDQLYEVWYLDKEVADRVLDRFPVLSKPNIVKVNVNTADFKTVMRLPYMDYETTKKIFNYKNAAGKITSMEILRKIEGFPVDKFDRISLYLNAE